MRRSTGFWFTVLAVVVLWSVITGSALAAPPLKLDSGLVTDDADVLGTDLSAVEDALETLESDYGVHLFVVYVETFDGYDAQEWAHETASINGLGLNDVLLAVAVLDREYAWSVDDDFPLSDAELDDVAAEWIEPALSDEDWGAAAVAAAEGYADALDAQDEPTVVPATGDEGDGGGGSLWCCLLPGVLAAGLAGLGAFLFKRRGKGGKSGGAGAPGAPTTKELETSAGKLLVSVDEALRSSEQELGFAEAEFGSAAIDEYRAALDASKGEVAEAFRIQQQVFDAEPEDEATRRQMLEKIIALANAADARLDEKADAFKRLRDLAGRADEVLASLGGRLEKLEADLPGAASALDALKVRYRESALGDVADNDTEAAGLVQAARKAAADGARVSMQGDRNAAALAARTAEDATATAEQLLAAVSAAGESLKAAEAALGDEATRLEAAAAGAEAQDATRYAALVAAARSAVSEGRNALASPPFDPLAHLAKVREVAGQLDAALAEARDQAQKLEAARASAQAAFTTARDRIQSAESFIATRSGAVGTQARSALAEARGRLQKAEQLLATDPAASLAEAQAAQQYAESALRYAQGDVAPVSTGAPVIVPGPISSGGISGGGSSSRSSSSGWSGFGGSSRRSGGGGFSSSGSSRSSSSSSSHRSSSSSSRSSGGRRGGGGRF